MTDQFETDNAGDLRASVESYLSRNGWVAGEPGRFGDLWGKPGVTDVREEDAQEWIRIAVPRRVEPRSREYNALVSRLSASEKRPILTIADEVEGEFHDVQSYRIADSFVSEESVLLDSAYTVLVSAKRLIRAASTTARKPKAYIGSNFSAPADEIANRARLSHTRRGSFVLPVVMPLERSLIVEHQILDETTEVVIESDERRATRTLAAALTALDAITVHSDREPGTDELIHLVESGVSKELVSAVRAIATDSGVHAFETNFRWAPGVGTPGGMRDRVLIPDDASPILQRLETKLRRASPRADESISGQIVEIRHVPGDPIGEIAIRTARGRRTVEVRITTNALVIKEAADWFKSGRAILAHGEISATPGRPLSMPRPISVTPLDRIYLDTFSEDSGSASARASKP
jgi:hypothetical protein